MSRLPPPPHFALPPPPMPPLDVFDSKIISQLTCSSIRQHYQHTTTMTTSSRLILFTSASVIVAILLFIITSLWLFTSSRKRNRSRCNKNLESIQPPSTLIDSMFDLSTSSSRSYETISYDHTGVYLESVDTSATTCSMDTTSIICLQCSRQYVHQHSSYYHILGIPDVIPN